MIYIVTSLTGLVVYFGANKRQATQHAIHLNQLDSDHPLFYPWEDGVYIGTLHREFGEDFSDDPWMYLQCL